MPKIIERDPAPDKPSVSTSPALAVQFFLIPLAVVAMVAVVYGGFRMLLTTERTPEQYLQDVQSGGRERRWPAAYELSRMMADPDVEMRHPTLGSAIVEAFRNSEGDDPRVRRYLALSVGRLSNPPSTAVGALVEGLDDPNSETTISVIWALAALNDPSVREDIQALYASADPGVRKMAVYALGSLPSDGDLSVLRRALNDVTPDVQWNAAVALARQGADDGVAVLVRMLDREYVGRMVDRVPAVNAPLDPISEVMISSLQAIGMLGAVEVRDQVDTISRDDENLRVRELAIRTLELMEPRARESDTAMRHR